MVDARDFASRRRSIGGKQRVALGRAWTWVISSGRGGMACAKISAPPITMISLAAAQRVAARGLSAASRLGATSTPRRREARIAGHHDIGAPGQRLADRRDRSCGPSPPACPMVSARKCRRSDLSRHGRRRRGRSRRSRRPPRSARCHHRACRARPVSASPLTRQMVQSSMQHGAERLVESDRRRVPVEHRPLRSARSRSRRTWRRDGPSAPCRCPCGECAGRTNRSSR